MKYPNVEAYVKEHGYEMKDLTPDEVKEATEEMEAINNGFAVLDGVFSQPLKKDLIKAYPDIANVVKKDSTMTKEERIKELEADGLSPEDIQFELDRDEFLAKYPDAPVSEDIECLNLIMRKEFALQLLRGEKKVEVRDYSPFYYNRIFDKKVEAWTNNKADEMTKAGVDEETVDSFVTDCVDFLKPLRVVKKIHFHDYNNSWFLDVECVANYQLAVVRDQVKTVQDLYDCHEFDEMLEDLEKKNATDRPMFFYFVMGRVLETNLA